MSKKTDTARDQRERRKAVRELERRAKREGEQMAQRAHRVELIEQETKEKQARLRTLLQKEPDRLHWIANIEAAVDALEDERAEYVEGIAINRRDLAGFVKEIAKLQKEAP